MLCIFFARIEQNPAKGGEKKTQQPKTDSVRTHTRTDDTHTHKHNGLLNLYRVPKSQSHTKNLNGGDKVNTHEIILNILTICRIKIDGFSSMIHEYVCGLL